MEENEIYEIPSEMSDLLDEKEKKNYRKNIVTKIAYLIGVWENTLENSSLFAVEELDELRKNEDATIIRNLCILRTRFFQIYGKIVKEKWIGKRIRDFEDSLGSDVIKYLESKGIEVISVSENSNPGECVAYINYYIQKNIDKIENLMPEWIKFKYIRNLFLMPGAYAGENGCLLKKSNGKIVSKIQSESKSYASANEKYPYHMYLSWKFGEKDGNILRNDLKFLKLLYKANNDEFTANQYVTDARDRAKEDIYKFLVDAMEIEVYVDCENADPYAFAATLKNLDDKNLSKISKINLYDDINASTAWDYISEIIDIPVKHYEVQRVIENKSLVDMAMALDIQSRYYENDVRSAILVSSDSDFWTTIEKLDNKVNFFVFNEQTKTSPAIIDALDAHGVPHCYMNEFAQADIQRFKSEVLYLGLESRTNEFNETGDFYPLNVDELIDELFKEAYIKGEETQIKKEKESFFNKYFKNGFWIKPVLENGERKLKIELKRK